MLPSRPCMLSLRLAIRQRLNGLHFPTEVGGNGCLPPYAFGNNLFPAECREGVGHALSGKTDLDIHAGMLRRELLELYEGTH